MNAAGLVVERGPAPPAPPAARAYRPRGAALELFYAKDKEVGLSGPAGTGKSRANLEKIHFCALKYPGMRALIVRKTRESLTESGLVTFEERVLPEGSPLLAGPRRQFRQAYHYPNESTLVVGGLDKASKIMSTEFDLIYVMEAIEISENDHESLTTRLRNGVMPYQQLIFDTNPDRPTHWLKARANAGLVRMLESRHEDNPVLYDEAAGDWTPAGRAYIETLDRLTGPRKDRLRHGRWVTAEGVVYEWEPACHLVDRFEVPAAWPRYWAIDFGYTNPFVWQEWATDPDGRLYLVREIYRTQTLVEDHAARVVEITKTSPRPVAVICDHDAEGRATFEKHAGVRTVAAYKAISEGVQAVQARLQAAGDGRPRLYVLRDALDRRDQALVDRKLPASTVEEFDGYVWDLSNKRKKGEVPVDKDNHGMDAMRYMVAHLDARPAPPPPPRFGVFSLGG